MPEKARVGVLISGRGSNMAALLYASRLYDCPYEIVVVGSNDPDAAGLALAAADADLAIADAGIRLARANRVPDINIGPALRRLEATNDTAAVLFPMQRAAVVAADIRLKQGIDDHCASVHFSIEQLQPATIFERRI